jgi:uncharacterized protein (DUF2147 family)
MPANTQNFRAQKSPRLYTFTFASVLFAIVTAMSSHALADDPTGVWLVQDGSAKVRVGACSGALCGNVIWIRQPIDPANGKLWLDEKSIDPNKRRRPILGIRVVIDMKPSRIPNKWTGRVYSIDHGKHFDGSLTLLTPTKLKIEGCLMLICESEIWTRAD